MTVGLIIVIVKSSVLCSRLKSAQLLSCQLQQRTRWAGQSPTWGRPSPSILANITFLFVDLRSRDFFMERGRNRCQSHFFPIFDIWSNSEDIRNQSRKLSKIALHFPRFFALPNFRGQAFRNLYQCYDPCLPARRMENVLWGYSH